MDNYTYTYLVKTEYLNKKAIREVFDERGNWKEYEKGDHVTFMYKDGKYLNDRSLDQIESDIASVVKKPGYGVYMKDSLYDIFMKYNKQVCEKYMVKQYNITNNNYQSISKEMFGDKIWILKGVLSHSGKDIFILTDYKQYLEFFEKKHVLSRWVLMEYIDDPLLVFNRKFHLRVNYMVYGKDAYYQTRPEIMTAADSYVKENYENKKIHDTHLSTSIPNLYFPDGFNIYGEDKVNFIRKQFDDLFYHISQMLGNLSCYTESKSCFEIFGVDLMITNNYKIKLIEINIKISKRTEYDWTKKYLEGILETIFDPLFPPKNKINKHHFFTKIRNKNSTDKPVQVNENSYHEYIKYKNKYIKEKNNHNKKNSNNI